MATCRDNRWIFEPPIGFGDAADMWESQFWSIPEIEKYQAKSLENIVGYACKNVPYYGEYSGKPFSLFPFISKREMRGSGFDSKVTDKETTFQFSSSGSTGDPFIYKSNTYDFTCLGMQFWYMYIIKECGVNLFGDDKVLGFSLKGDRDAYINIPIDERVKIDVKYSEAPCHWMSLSLLKHKNLSIVFDNALRILADKNYKCIIGPPTIIIDFIQYAESHHINLNHHKIITSAEQVYPEMRKFLKDRGFFHRDYYHSPDGGLSAYECSCGNYHFNHLRAFVETIEIGSEKYLCSTAFYNTSMPFIRYVNYDSISSLEKGACACGRSGYYASSINGRYGERLVDSQGGLVVPMIIYSKISALTGLGKWKVVQNDNGTNLYVDNYMSAEAAKAKVMLREHFDNVSVKDYNDCRLVHNKRLFIIRES